MNYFRWKFIKMIFSLAPFAIRLFIFLFGNNQSNYTPRIVDLPELMTKVHTIKSKEEAYEINKEA